AHIVVMSASCPQIGTDSRKTVARLTGLDGRTRLARLMRQTRRDLLAHVGGRPSMTQAMLIERAVTLTAYLARLDAEALSPAGMSDHRCREYPRRMARAAGDRVEGR